MSAPNRFRRVDPLERHALAVDDPRAVPFAVGSFEEIGALSRADYPHRHSFYEIVLVTAGTGWHVMDFEAHPVRPPQLGLITPGQVHYWHRTVGLDGIVLLFTDDALATHPADRRGWYESARRPWPTLTDRQADRFAELLRDMAEESRRREPGFRTVVPAYLHVLLVAAARVVADAAATAGPDRAAAVSRDFHRLVAEHAAVVTSVGDYARRLGVTVGHLSEVVRQVSGATPGAVIRRARAWEARRLLGGSELTVGQVSRALGFTDPAYFCRFFRRETGSTPGGYRREAARLR